MGLDQLTAEQRERLPSFIQEWIEAGWRTTPLTDGEWQTWGTGLRTCYEAAGHRWADGWAVHFWHGTRVPADLIETGWDADRILAEPNTEIRRCAIERMGWGRFVTAAGLKLLDSAPDPANPGQWLRLYDVPRQLLNERARALVCANATCERDGTRRNFGLTVPADCRSALTAAAWTFDIPESDYTNLAQAT